MSELKPEIRAAILAAQKNEITEHFIYARLARKTDHDHNREVLERISADELKHYEFWKRYTGEEVKPNRWAMFKYSLILSMFGMTFGLRLMEKGEGQAQIAYKKMLEAIPATAAIIKDEDLHEQSLIGMLDEEKLKYIGALVLGLSDALVELTGALAGFTLALQNTRLIALVGLVTGIAAALSMAASEYLALQHDETSLNPLKAAVYTGIAYLITVVLLVLPFLILPNYYLALGLTILLAILIILVFTYYVSVAKNLPFTKRFLEMALISLSVAALSFGLGYAIRKLFKISA